MLTSISEQISTFFRYFQNNSLFRNSFYLMLSTGVLGAFGFLFWVICSRIFDPATIGLATSFISATSLVSGFSLFGFNNATIRFLPGSLKKNSLISTQLIVSGVASLVATVIFLIWMTVSHFPIINNQYPFWWILLFLLTVIIGSVGVIIDNVFVAYRATSYILLKSTFLSVLKIVLIFVLFFVGIKSLSIIASLTIAAAAGMGFSLILLALRFNYRPQLRIDTSVIKELYVFAMGNYFGGLLSSLPSTVVPLIVLSRLGAKEAAFFYIPIMIIGLLNIIPNASAQSLFAEISHNEGEMVAHLRTSIKHLFLMMIPAALAIIVLGSFVLNYFGPAYAQAGTIPLQIFVLSSLVGALNYFGDTLLNVKKRMRSYVTMNALVSITIVVFSYFAAPYGLAAIAWSSFVAQVLTLAVYAIVNWDLVSSLLTAPA